MVGPVLGPSLLLLSLGVRFRGHLAGPGFAPQLFFFFIFSSASGASLPAFAVVSARDAGPAASGAEGPGPGHLRWGEGVPWQAAHGAKSPRRCCEGRFKGCVFLVATLGKRSYGYPVTYRDKTKATAR